MDCLLTLLDGEDPDLSDEDAPPPLPGLISLLEMREGPAGQVPPGGAIDVARLLAKKFGVPLTDAELQRLAEDLRTAFNIISLEDVEKKLAALRPLVQKLRIRLGR
ncbi:MAG: hypothetical protein HYY93_05125 [Planctomycetes bacterium]|nr:hypothetical protein [Planctomycetota bacterium]